MTVCAGVVDREDAADREDVANAANTVDVDVVATVNEDGAQRVSEVELEVDRETYVAMPEITRIWKHLSRFSELVSIDQV